MEQNSIGNQQVYKSWSTCTNHGVQIMVEQVYKSYKSNSIIKNNIQSFNKINAAFSLEYSSNIKKTISSSRLENN